MDKKLKTQIINTLKKKSTGMISIGSVESNNFVSNGKLLNQFMVMLKPELTAINDGVDVESILDDISCVFERNNINIGGIKILSGNYLEKNKVLNFIYPSLSGISNNGIMGCPSEIKEKIQSYAEIKKISYKNILGASQFLQKFNDFSALSLETLSRNVQIQKFGNGCYLIEVVVKGEDYLVLNPFHPYQKEWFHSEKSNILIFECISEKSFRDIRENVIGSLEPKAANTNSLKGMLYEKKYGIENITTAFNGYHISPGLVEGLRAVIYFFYENDISAVKKTSLGTMLLDIGLTEKEIYKLLNNFEVVVNETLIDDILDNTEFMNLNELQEYFKKIYEKD